MHQFGETITRQQFADQLSKIGSKELSEEEKTYEGFDLLIDFKVGIYTPDDLRAMLHCIHRAMRKKIDAIDELFWKMHIDSHDYRNRVLEVINEACDLMDGLLPSKVFASNFLWQSCEG